MLGISMLRALSKFPPGKSPPNFVPVAQALLRKVPFEGETGIYIQDAITFEGFSYAIELVDAAKFSGQDEKRRLLLMCYLYLEKKDTEKAAICINAATAVEIKDGEKDDEIENARKTLVDSTPSKPSVFRLQR